MFTIGIDPVAFTIGSLEVRWYGILIAIAVAAVIVWMIRQVDKRKPNLPAPPDIAVAPVGIISGIIGAKLVHVLERLDYYIQHPVEIFSGGGLAIYGGVLGATLGIWIYLKRSRRQRKNQHFGFFSDLVAPGIILAQAIGRIGCTINGCCHGKPAPDWFPWTIKYSDAYPPPNGYYVQNLNLLDKPLYPTQPAEIVFCLVTFVILLTIRKRLQRIEGSLFMVYLIMYSAWRIGLGFFRSADLYFISGILSQAQIISIVVLAVCITLLVHMRHRFRTSQQKAGSEEDSSPPATMPDD
jgi:phosphatidylglycerol:prolipoprotein diacylglycerol transferase